MKKNILAAIRRLQKEVDKEVKARGKYASKRKDEWEDSRAGMIYTHQTHLLERFQDDLDSAAHTFDTQINL